MTDVPSFQQRLDWLRQGEIRPLLIGTDTSYGSTFEVRVVLLDPEDAVPGGYATFAPPLLSVTHEQNPETPEEDLARRAAAIGAFAEKMNRLIQDA